MAQVVDDVDVPIDHIDQFLGRPLIAGCVIEGGEIVRRTWNGATLPNSLMKNCATTRPLLVVILFLALLALSGISIATTRFESNLFSLFPAQTGPLRLFLDSMEWTGSIKDAFFILEGDRDIAVQAVREGYLVAASESGRLFPVIEVLAANPETDCAVIRVKLDEPVKALALNTNVCPGDSAWCYSDPLGRSGYFSKGMVNRFYLQQRSGRESARMEVSTEWAPGSSGAAVLDECGNAIGHVSEISSAGSGRSSGTNHTGQADSPVMVFHNAARAADVLALIKPPARRKHS